MLFLFSSTITNDMDFAWTLWAGKQLSKYSPILENDEQALSEYSTCLMTSLGNIVFHQISLLAFSLTHCHIATPILTDIGVRDCHFCVLLRWLSSHRPPCIPWEVPAAAVCRNCLSPAPWVFVSQSLLPNYSLGYSAGLCVCNSPRHSELR